jgi:hypothetical protein
VLGALQPIISKAAKKCVGYKMYMLSEPSDIEVLSRVPWDSEPRIIVLARASSNLAVSSHT